MQKNVLRESINELGIFEGDVIKLPSECGNDYYQLKDGELKFLGSLDKENESETMSDDEYIELITGREFEIISKNENPYVETIRDQVSEITITTNDINKRMDKVENNLSDISEALIENYKQVKKEKEKREKQDWYILWAECGFLAFALILLLIKLFI